MIATSHIPYIYDQPVYLIKDKDAKDDVLLPKKEDAEPLITSTLATPDASIAPKEVKKTAEEIKIEAIKATPIIDKSLEILKEKCLKKIWLWVNPKDGEVISAAEHEMITKTMTALGVLPNELSIFVPYEIAHSHFNKLDFKDKRIVDFGMCPPNINAAPLPTNIIQTVRNSKYLYTLPLHQLQENLAIKKEWWAQMKVLLG